MACVTGSDGVSTVFIKPIAKPSSHIRRASDVPAHLRRLISCKAYKASEEVARLVKRVRKPKGPAGSTKKPQLHKDKPLLPHLGSSELLSFERKGHLLTRETIPAKEIQALVKVLPLVISSILLASHLNFALRPDLASSRVLYYRPNAVTFQLILIGLFGRKSGLRLRPESSSL